MPFKCIFFTTQQADRLGGWGSQFYNQLTDIDPCIAAVRRLQAKLQRLLGNTTFLPTVRISDMQGFRAVVNVPFPGTQAGNPASFESDYQTTGIQLRMSGQGAKGITTWLTGIPDNQITGGGFFQATYVYRALFSTFASELVNAANGWSIYVLDPATPKKFIQNITQAGVVTANGHGYVQDDVVRIQRCKNWKYPNQIWRINFIDLNTYSLQGWVVPVVPVPYQGKGFSKKQSYIFQSITKVIVARATSHKRGRPFGLLSGKSKKKAI